MAGTSSFERGLAVLGALTRGGPARADRLAAELSMPLSTVYRYLKALREAGFVEEAHGRYWAAGSHVPGGELARSARPLLERLGERTGETALLTVRSGLQAVCLDQVVPAPGNVFPLHQPLPIHAGASKRVLLAYASARLRDRVLSSPLERYTPVSPDPAALRRLLLHTRRQGAAISYGEFIPGSLAVAVPVLRANRLVGALAVSGRASRLEPGWASRALRELRRAGADLEARL